MEVTQAMRDKANEINVDCNNAAAALNNNDVAGANAAIAEAIRDCGDLSRMMNPVVVPTR